MRVNEAGYGQIPVRASRRAPVVPLQWNRAGTGRATRRM